MIDGLRPAAPAADGRIEPEILQKSEVPTAERFDWRSVVAEVDASCALLPASLHAAEMLTSVNQPDAALAVYEEMLERDPVHLEALRAKCTLLERMMRFDEVQVIRQRLFKIEANELGVPEEAVPDAVAFFVAAETKIAPPAVAPPEYVAALFDRYAPRFDRSLVEGLGYRGPEFLVKALAKQLPAARGGRDRVILDAGCGTGLAGPLLKPYASRLTGIDLSSRMIARAAERGVYDELQTGELVEAIGQWKRRFDVIAAVDVLTYFGELRPVFEAVRESLRPNGLFAFTVEESMSVGFELRATRRFTHHEQFVRDCAQECRLRLVSIDRAHLRIEAAQPVTSLVVVCAVN